MTYYLIRTFADEHQETIPFSASGTVDAIRKGQRLHDPRAVASYAQIRDREGKVVCTYLSNDKGPGRSVPQYVQLNLFDQV